MKQFAALLKLNLKYYVLPKFDSKKSRTRFIALAALTFVAFLAPLAMICMTLWFAAQAMLAMGMCSQLLAGVFTMSQVLVIFFSIYTYISSIFFAKDNEIVLNLPVRGVEVFASKLMCTYLNELVVSAIVVLPITIVTAAAGIQGGYGHLFGAQYWILIPFAIVLLPVMPLLILSVVAFPIAMLVQKLSKKPMISAILQAVFVLAFVGVVYFFSYSSTMSLGGEGQTDTSAFTALGSVSFYTAFLADAMLGFSSAGNFFAFLGITVAMAAAALGLSVLLYRRAISMSVDGGGAQKRRTKEKTVVQRSASKSLVMTQLKTMARSPDIFVNLLLTLLMPVLIAALMCFIMPSAEELVADDPEATLDMFDYIGYFTIGLIAMTLMISSPTSNICASYAFSLEKDNICTLKSMPISGRNIVLTKLAIADAVSLISVALVAIVLPFAISLPWYTYVLFPVFLALYLVGCNTFSMSRDLRRPKFNWVTIKELTKAANSGTNFIMMIIGVALGLVAGLPAMIVAFAGAALPPYAVQLIVWLPMAAVSITSFIVMGILPLRHADRDFRDIEP